MIARGGILFNLSKSPSTFNLDADWWTNSEPSSLDRMRFSGYRMGTWGGVLVLPVWMLPLGAAMLALVGFSAKRRRWRALNLCSKCGYPLRGALLCSECGRAASSN
jgi:hypothetical protein